MTAEAWFTRREGDTLSRRVDFIDQDGPRAMAMLAAQTRDNAAAIGRLQQEVHERFAEHTRQHEREERQRMNARRWRITSLIAAVAAAAAVLTLLVAILAELGRLHH